MIIGSFAEGLNGSLAVRFAMEACTLCSASKVSAMVSYRLFFAKEPLITGLFCRK